MDDPAKIKPLKDCPIEHWQALQVIESVTHQHIHSMQEALGPKDGGSIALSGILAAASRFVMEACPGSDPKAVWDKVCKVAWDNLITEQMERAKGDPNHG